MRPSPFLTLQLLALAGIFASASVAQTTVTLNITGPVVGHNVALQGTQESIFDQSGNSITHPLHNHFDGIYTNLTGAESFDFDTGLELSAGSNALNSTVYPSDPSAPTGLGYWSALVGINHGLSGTLGVSESAQLGFAFTGFNLNLGSSADYFINTNSLVETRVYRGGVVSVFDLSNNSLVYTSSGLAATISIDWDGNDTNQTPYDLVTGDAAGGDIDVSITGWTSVFDTFYSDSASPVQVNGGTVLGAYAIYNGTGQITASAVPEVSTTHAVFALLGAGLFYRFRRRRAAAAAV